MEGIPLTEQEHAENVAMWKRFEPTTDKEKKRRKSPAKKEKHDKRTFFIPKT
jgi:hypothetical protein